MKKVRVLPFCWLLAFAAISSFAAEPPKKRALLIGISDYEYLEDLRGATNDVDLIRTVLTGKFGFLPENITILKDSAATADAVIAAFKKLSVDVNPNDVVYIHFSGYGSEIVDVSGDSVTGYDSTLVPYDSHGGSDKVVVDDRLEDLVGLMATVSDKVTVVIDSCFRAFSTRSGSRGRCLGFVDEMDYEIQAYEQKSAKELLTYRGNREYALILAATRGEIANEAQFGDRTYGALSYEFADVLVSAPVGASFSDSLERVANHISSRFRTQTPQWWLPRPDAPLLFDENFSGEWAGYVYFSGAEQVKLSGGSFHGLQLGMELDVYAPLTSSFDRSRRIGKIQVSRLTDTESTADIVGGKAIPPGAIVRLPEVESGLRLSVWIDTAAVQEQFATALQSSLEALETVAVVEKQADAQLQVTALEDGYAVVSGDLMILEGGLVSTNAVVAEIERWVSWFNVLELKNPGDDPPATLTITAEGADDGSVAGIRPGDIIDYRISNPGNRSIFVNGLVTSSDGSVNVLRELSGRLGAGQSMTGRLATFLPKDRESVTDTLKIIATRRAADLNDLLNGAPAPYRFQNGPWSTAQVSWILKRQRTRVNSFAVHYDDPARASVTGRSGQQRMVCAEGSQSDCLIGDSLDEGSIVILDRTLQRSNFTDISPGEAFQEAYDLQRRLNADRVEPLFEAAYGDDYTNLAGRSKSDKNHHPFAAEDKHWSRKYIRAPEAWEVLRQHRGVSHGLEASDVRIAHLDTGYSFHPELFGDGSVVLARAGMDLVDGDEDPFDTLSTKGLLPNPGHGTASGSVIVSPSDCQLDATPKNIPCITGIGVGAQLIPIRVHTSVVVFNQKRMATAILAVQKGDVGGDPRIISIAMGGPPSWALWKAVKKAEESGLLIIAAAGNNVGTVVWPARFRSTIAAAAVNVLCEPWSGTSKGRRVDISAPGESVWRAFIDRETFENGIGMSNGTTFATANTTGAAALWVARHMDSEEFAQLVDDGAVTDAFRNAVTASAWRPRADDPNRPETHCADEMDWNVKRTGAGILNAKGLLEQPLSAGFERSATTQTIDELPLYFSLYEEGAPVGQVRSDYNSIFSVQSADVGRFEAEILYHYSMNKVVQETLDATAVFGARDAKDFARTRDALLLTDLSDDLRAALKTP